MTDVNTPVQLLNIKVDRVIGIGNTKRAERLAATLEAKLMLLRAVAQAPGLAMARTGSETPAESSGSEDYLKADEEYNADEYLRAVSVVTTGISAFTRNGIRERLEREKRTQGEHLRDEQSLKRL